MQPDRGLEIAILTPRERHEQLLREAVIPIAREIESAPDHASFFFGRYNKPDWRIRFSVVGRPAWVDGPARRLAEAHAERRRGFAAVEAWEVSEYLRDCDEYGGEEGARLAERIFHADTLACLDLIEAEARGELLKSRREYSLLMTERFLDLMGFDRARRREFYAYAYSWTVTLGTWQQEELDILERKYRALRAGLIDLLDGDQSRDPEAQWGGAEPARIARACLDRSRPVVEELLAAQRAGRVNQNLVRIAWMCTHLHANRLGIEAWPEAILRYFMHRFHEEGLGEAG